MNKTHVHTSTLLVALIAIIFTHTTLSDDHSPDDYPPLGEAEYPGLCKYRGHIGKYQCLKVSATAHDRYSCKGKTLYYSKVNGNKGCYSCPKGYTRTSWTRKMNHDRACTLRRSGKNAYAQATKVSDVVGSCPDDQFKHDGHCKSCPEKTRREHVAGLDNGLCEVDKPYRCNQGLVLHKSAPEGIIDRMGNWAGLKHKKYCGIPFSLKQYGEDILNTDENIDVVEALSNLRDALTSGDRTSQEDFDAFKKAVKEERLKDAFDILAEFEELDTLINVLSEIEETAETVGGAALQFSITVGHVGDLSLGLGASYEWGVAIDYAETKVKKYTSSANTKGLSAGVDGSIIVGVWKGAYNSGYSQGYVGAFSAGTVGAGVGIWSDYYTPKRANGSNQPHFLGITVTSGFGAGFEVAEYGEVITTVKEYEEM